MIIFANKPRLIFSITLTLLFLSCSQRTASPDIPLDDSTSPLVSTYGSASTVDIATWNIETFPLRTSSTVNYLNRIFRDLQVDLIGVQEISNPSYFNSLLDSLSDSPYSGVIAPRDNFLRLGFIYNRDVISVSNVDELFVGDYDFPRPVLTAYVTFRKDNQTVFDFTFMIVHLKAYGDPESQQRRRDACEKLKEYIDTYILTSADPDVIVLGDWNDEVDDPVSDNVFQGFLDDPDHYRFLTRGLGSQVSYPSYGSMIDHILISSDALGEYNGGVTQVLTLDLEFGDYFTFISDHRPVLAKFNAF
jgi:hypothetical protein